MTVHITQPDRSRVTRQAVELEGRAAWRVRLVVEGRAVVAAFLAPGADSAGLGWCQRDQWLTALDVPLEGR